MLANTLEFSTKDTLNAVTIIKPFSMQKTDIKDSILSVLQKLIETYLKLTEELFTKKQTTITQFLSLVK